MTFLEGGWLWMLGGASFVLILALIILAIVMLRTNRGDNDNG